MTDFTPLIYALVGYGVGLSIGIGLLIWYMLRFNLILDKFMGEMYDVFYKKDTIKEKPQPETSSGNTASTS